MSPDDERRMPLTPLDDIPDDLIAPADDSPYPAAPPSPQVADLDELDDFEGEYGPADAAPEPTGRPSSERRDKRGGRRSRRKERRAVAERAADADVPEHDAPLVPPPGEPFGSPAAPPPEPALQAPRSGPSVPEPEPLGTDASDQGDPTAGRRGTGRKRRSEKPKPSKAAREPRGRKPKPPREPKPSKEPRTGKGEGRRFGGFRRGKDAQPEKPFEGLSIRTPSGRPLNGRVVIVDGATITDMKVRRGAPRTVHTFEHADEQAAKDAVLQMKLRGASVVWCSRQANPYKSAATLDEDVAAKTKAEVWAGELTDAAMPDMMGTRRGQVLVGMDSSETELLRRLDSSNRVYTSIAAGSQRGHWLRVGECCSELAAVDNGGMVVELAVLPVGTSSARAAMAAGAAPDEAIHAVLSELVDAVREECNAWRSRTRVYGFIYVHGPGADWSGLPEGLRSALGYVVARPPGEESVAPVEGRRGQAVTAALALSCLPMLWPRDTLDAIVRAARRRRIMVAAAVFVATAVLLGWSWRSGTADEARLASLQTERTALAAGIDRTIDAKLARADAAEAAIEAFMAPDPVRWGAMHTAVAAAERRFCDRTAVAPRDLRPDEDAAQTHDADGCVLRGRDDVVFWEQARCQSYEVILHYDVALPEGMAPPEGSVTPGAVVDAASELARTLYGFGSQPPAVSAESGWRLSTAADGDWMPKQFTITPPPDDLIEVCDPLAELARR